VSPKFLLTVFDTAYVLALATWLGGLACIGFGVLSSTDSRSGRGPEDLWLSQVLARIYAMGAMAGAIALPSFVAVPLCYPEYRGPLVGVQAIGILGGIVLMFYAGHSVSRIGADPKSREAGSEGDFNAFRRRLLWLNASVLTVGLGLIVGFVTRPAPRSSGIEELGPADRARYDSAINRVIENVESKYGFRPAANQEKLQKPGTATAAELPEIDREAVEELELYYSRKRQGTSQASPEAR
jgi:hypothetical protein